MNRSKFIPIGIIMFMFRLWIKSFRWSFINVYYYQNYLKIVFLLVHLPTKRISIAFRRLNKILFNHELKGFFGRARSSNFNLKIIFRLQLRIISTDLKNLNLKWLTQNIMHVWSECRKPNPKWVHATHAEPFILPANKFSNFIYDF